MVTQYPHTLTAVFTTDAEPAYQDALGNWVIPSGTEEVAVFECRAEANDSGREIRGVDGTLVKFGYIIYMPLTEYNFAYGQDVDIVGMTTGTVKKFHRGQLNCRIWI